MILHRGLFRRPFNKGAAAQRSSYRPCRLQLEVLEERRLLSASVTVNGNVNVTRLVGNQNEPAIAVNPTNPSNLFLVANNEDGTTQGLFEAVSTDQGKTWLGVKKLFPADTVDARTVFDSFGNLFVALVDSSASVRVLLSTDGGQSFRQVGNVVDGSADRPAIAAGSGSVWISYRDHNHQSAAIGARVSGLGMVGPFSTPEDAPGSLNGNFSDIAIGPAGQVLVTYQSMVSEAGPDIIHANLDADGLGPLGFSAQLSITSTNVGGVDLSVFAQSAVQGINAEPELAWDVSGGAHNGRVYLVYTDAPAVFSVDTNIFERFSDDNGLTWSAPVRVNDDTSLKSQFLPTLAVDQTTGNLAVAWHDARNSVPNTATQIFASFSVDGGLTFLTNVQVSAGTSVSARAGSPVGFGDFIAAEGAFSHGIFHPAWADNSNSTGDNPGGAPGQFDVYTAAVALTVPPPSPTPSPGSVPPPLAPAAQPAIFFVITPDGSLFRHDDPAGFTRIGNPGSVVAISAVTEASGNVVLFALGADHALSRYTSATGWDSAVIGNPGSITAISAGTDASGQADVFVLGSDGAFLQWRRSTSWSLLGLPGSILSFSAVKDDEVFVITADHSVFGHGPQGWFRESDADFAQSISAVTDAAGHVVFFTIGLDASLSRHDDPAGFQQLGLPGSTKVISAGTDEAGQADVFTITAANDLAENDTTPGWSILHPPLMPVDLSASVADRVFMILADGSVLLHEDTSGFIRESDAGFATLVSAAAH